MSNTEKRQQQSGMSSDRTEEVRAPPPPPVTSSDRRARILDSFKDLPLLPDQAVTEAMPESDEDSPTDYGYRILSSDDDSRRSLRRIIRQQARSFKSPTLSDIEEDEPIPLRASLIPITTLNRFPIDGSGSNSSASPDDDNIQNDHSAGGAKSNAADGRYSPRSAEHEEPLRNLQGELGDNGSENGSASSVSDGSYKQFISTLDECEQPLEEEQLPDYKLTDTRDRRTEDSRNSLELRRFGRRSQTPVKGDFEEAHDKHSDIEDVERGRKRYRDPLPGEYKSTSQRVQNHAALGRPNANKLSTRPPRKPPIFYKDRASLVKIRDTKVLKWLLSSTEIMIKLSRDIESLMFQAWYYANSQEWYLALAKIEKARSLRAELIAFNQVYQRHINFPDIPEWIVQQSRQPMSRVPSELSTRTIPGFVYKDGKGHQKTLNRDMKPVESRPSNSNEVTSVSLQPITRAEGGDIGLCRLTRQQSGQEYCSERGGSSEGIPLPIGDRKEVEKGNTKTSIKKSPVASSHDDFVASGQNGYIAPEIGDFDRMRELLDVRIQETSREPEHPRRTRVIDSLKNLSAVSLQSDSVASGRNGYLASEIGEYDRMRSLLNTRRIQNARRELEQPRRRLRVVNGPEICDSSESSSASSKPASNKKEGSKSSRSIAPPANVTQPFSFEGRPTSRDMSGAHYQNEPAFVREPISNEFNYTYKRLTSLHVDKETAAKIWESNWDRLWVWPEAKDPSEWPKVENPALMDDPVITPALLWEILKRKEEYKTSLSEDEAACKAWNEAFDKYRDPDVLARYDEMERDEKRRIPIQPYIEALRWERGLEMVSKWARGVFEVVDGKESSIDDRLWFHVGASSESEIPIEDRDLETDRLLVLGAPFYPMAPPRSDLSSSSRERNPLLAAWDEPDSRTVEEKRRQTYQILIGEITERVAGGCYDNLAFLGDPTHQHPISVNTRRCLWFGTNVLWKEEWFTESSKE